MAAGRAPTEQDRLLWAIARPERLLALASRYTVFEAGSRKLARYQQYFAVEEILERVQNPDASGMRRGGLVWHTQGSGKSLTMVMLAEALLTQFASVSPRIVLVTDRVDLDDQIYGTFVASGVAAEQAKTGRDLLKLLTGVRTQVVTTLLQKFEAAVNVNDTVLDSPDIFVLVDEGHRSQTGQFHAAMRRVLPKACFIGFTGTPVFKSQLPTIERFGGLIGSAYTIDQAVADKAVVPLLYEGRYVQQHVDQIPIDEWFKKYTTGLTEEQRADLKRKYSSADQLNRTEQKVRAIAWDVSEHFQTNFKGAGFKGQLVTPSKATALLYKRFLDEFGMVTSEVLISPPDTGEGDEDAAPGKRAVRAVLGKDDQALRQRVQVPEGPDVALQVGREPGNHHRRRQAADRVRRAAQCGAVSDALAQGPQAAAGDCAREPGQRGQGRRPDRRLLRHSRAPDRGAGAVHGRRERLPGPPAGGAHAAQRRGEGFATAAQRRLGGVQDRRQQARPGGDGAIPVGGGRAAPVLRAADGVCQYAQARARLASTSTRTRRRS